MLKEATDRQHVRSERTKRSNETKTDKVLDLLQSIPGEISNHELTKFYVRWPAAIHNLRDRGHVIECRETEDAMFYRYAGYVPHIKVDDDWKARYYASPHWHDCRKARLYHDGYQCCHCKSKVSLEVHHWAYDLFAEDIEDLMTLCSTCHERMHGQKGVKLSFPRYVPEVIYYRLQNKPHVPKPPTIYDRGGQGRIF